MDPSFDVQYEYNLGFERNWQFKKKNMRYFVNNFNKVLILPSKHHKFKKHFGASCLIYNLFGYNLLPLRRGVRVCVNVACVSAAVFISGYIWLHIWFPQALCVLIEYFIIVIHCAVQKKPFNFLGVMPIDDTLRFGNTEYIKLKKIHSSLIFLSLGLKCFTITSFCFLIPKYCSTSVITIDMFAIRYLYDAVDLYQIPRIIYFISIYYRARLLRKNILISFFRVGPCSDRRIKNALTPLMLYRKFLDGVEAASPQIDPMMMLSLFCSFPKILCFVYNSLWKLRSNGPTNQIMVSLYLLTTSLLELVLWLMPCVPGIINEMTSYQLHQLKLCVMNQRIECENRERRDELEALVQYMNARQFNYRVWRLVQVDASLLITMLSLFTTYIIVILQFSNMFK